MPEDRQALLDHYRTTRQALFVAIDGLSDDLLTERSLDGWSVKDHLAHLAVWDEVRAAEVERISAGFASAWRLTSEEDDAYNAMTYRARADLSLTQVRWELETSRERLLHAISAAPERALDPALYGEAGVRSDHEAEHTGWILNWRQSRNL